MFCSKDFSRNSVLHNLDLKRNQNLHHEGPSSQTESYSDMVLQPLGRIEYFDQTSWSLNEKYFEFGFLFNNTCLDLLGSSSGHE